MTAPEMPYPPAELAARLAELLISHHQTIAVAECAAGGLVSSLLTDIVGSSAWYVGGGITYSARAWAQLADVGPEVAAQHGAVSEEMALALARGIRARLGADWGIAETGIAGPLQGRRSSKPVGLAGLAVVGGDGDARIERSSSFPSTAADRAGNRRAFAEALLRMAIEVIGESEQLAGQAALIPGPSPAGRRER